MKLQEGKADKNQSNPQENETKEATTMAIINVFKRNINRKGLKAEHTRNDLYLADSFIPKMPRLLPNGLNNPNNNFWNK